MKYIERRNGGLYVTGTRVSLDSVVHQFRQGASPESILRSFPMLRSLERVYGAIAYYLARQAEIDAYLGRQEKLWERSRKRQPPVSRQLLARLEQAAERTASSRRS